MEIIRQAYGEKTQRRLLRRIQTDLWFLSTEILEYDLLDLTFHKPMMDDMDAHRALRMAGKPIPFDHEMWPRDYFKTTVRKTQVVQDFAVDILDTICWWHAVEEQAGEVALSVGKILQKNKAIRKIFPADSLPAVNKAKFATSKGFRLPGNERKRDRLAPSMRAWGAGSEATGGHAKRGYVDDPIGENTILDSKMPIIKGWFGSTVRNVISTGKPGAKTVYPIFGSGTHWASDDMYVDWRKSKHWNVRVRACYEKDGVPDYDGDPVLYSREQIEHKRSGMTEYQFSCQMMNDAKLAKQKLWVPGTGRVVSAREISKIPGTVFVLSDPAPAKVGSFDQRGEKARRDDTKNEWAICAVKLMVVGNQQIYCLLDGDSSFEWAKDDGFRRNCQFAMRYSTPYVINEATGNAIALYWPDQVRLAREMGCPLYLGKEGHGIRLAWTYKGKNNYFESLATKAQRGQFWVLETCNQEFYDGFCEQAKDWRCLPSGKNGLKFDDRANVVSFCTDPALLDFAPTPEFADEDDDLEYRIEEEMGSSQFEYVEGW